MSLTVDEVMPELLDLSQRQSGVPRRSGWRLSETPLPSTHGALLHVRDLVFSPSSLDRARVAFRFVCPVAQGRGRLAPPDARPLRQHLPAAAVVVADALRDALDVVVRAAGAGGPAAPPTVSGVQ